MVGPVRADWCGATGDGAWRGWWGDDSSYHHDVFVLTHHRRAPLAMPSGTTFHVVTGGVFAALERATAAAGGLDVRVGGGAATIQRDLAADLVDELHLVSVPVLFGRGERLFDHLDGGPAGFECTELAPGDGVVHARFVRT